MKRFYKVKCNNIDNINIGDTLNLSNNKAYYNNLPIGDIDISDNISDIKVKLKGKSHNINELIVAI